MKTIDMYFSHLVTAFQHGFVVVSNVVQHSLWPSTIIRCQMFLSEEKNNKHVMGS